MSSRVIQDFESKLAYFPNPRNKTIHKVLITTEGVDDGLLRRHYFDSIIMLEDIFEAAE